MPLSKGQIGQLTRIITSMQQLISEAETAQADGVQARNAGPARTRRTGQKLIEFRKAIKAERRAGASVAELATKHGVTPSYIYQL